MYAERVHIFYDGKLSAVMEMTYEKFCFRKTLWLLLEEGIKRVLSESRKMS